MNSSLFLHNCKKVVQVAARAGGLSALIVVGMAVIGIAVLYATFYVWLGVDSPGSMKVTDCMSGLLPLTKVFFFFFPGFLFYFILFNV